MHGFFLGGATCKLMHWHQFPSFVWPCGPDNRGKVCQWLGLHATPDIGMFSIRKAGDKYANACDGTLLCAFTFDFSISSLPGFTFSGRHVAMCIGIDFSNCLGHVSLVFPICLAMCLSASTGIDLVFHIFLCCGREVGPAQY